jgi:molybdopterin-binding protein
MIACVLQCPSETAALAASGPRSSVRYNTTRNVMSICIWPLTPAEAPCYPSRMTLSARNRLEGKVTEMESGGVMTHVVVRVGKNVVESVITKRSAQEMKLKVGDTVNVVIKSTEVMLEKK